MLEKEFQVANCFFEDSPDLTLYNAFPRGRYRRDCFPINGVNVCLNHPPEHASAHRLPVDGFSACPPVHLPDEFLELAAELRAQLLVGDGVQVTQALFIGERPVEQVAVTVGEGRRQAAPDAVLRVLIRGAGWEWTKGCFQVLFRVNILVLIVN